MAGGWASPPGFANGQAISFNTTYSDGVQLLGASTANTKGAWTTLITTTYDVVALQVSVITWFLNGAYCVLDIAIGPSGSEQPIIQNVAVNPYESQTVSFLVPCIIKAGTRVAARIQSTSTNDATTGYGMYLGVVGFDSGWWDGAPKCSVVDTYGFVAASTHGTSVDPGTTLDTKGAWSQLGTLTYDITGFMLCFDGAGQAASGTTANGSSFLLDVGIGASGSQVVVVPNLYSLRLYPSYPSVMPCFTPWLMMPLPAGTLIWARAQAGFTTATSRLVGVTLYGMRQ